MGWGDCVEGNLEIVRLAAKPHAMLVGPFAGELAREIRKRILQERVS